MTGASKDNPDPLQASLVDLPEGDAERDTVTAFFHKSLGLAAGKTVNFVSIKRIESLSLWQSFVAKRSQMQKRAAAEGLDQAAVAAYEGGGGRMRGGSTPKASRWRCCCT